MRPEKYAWLLVRLAVGGVFAWFGTDKFIHPEFWLGWVPAYILNMLPFSDTLFIYSQGAVETVIGAVLIIGWYTRISALAAAAILLGITIVLGYSDIAVRDMGLLLAAVALALVRSHPWSMDVLREKQKR